MTETLRLPPVHLLACPKCGATPTTGLNPERQVCAACTTEFFDLAGMPCWFAVGQAQKVYWDSLFGLMLAAAELNQDLSQHQLDEVDLLPAVRQRLTRDIEINQQITQALSDLLTSAGLTPEINPAFLHRDASTLVQYHELLLRDWAWDQAKELPESENDGAFRRVHEALSAVGGANLLGDVLVLGAGAGRLSWDIHRHLQPHTTVALDNNPLLASLAHRLIIQQQPWQLLEAQPNRQLGLPTETLWHLSAPCAPAEVRAGWYAMAADAWQAPLRPGSFDLIVTPWFIDVNGRDIRELIGLITSLLKPGGRWINSGPLLYSAQLPQAQRYTHEEVVELLGLAGFTLHYQSEEVVQYLKSPLSTQVRGEQIWTFSALRPEQLPQGDTAYPPAWLQLAHLPIPLGIGAKLQGEPVLNHLLSLVDGYMSIAQIAALMAPNLEQGQDAMAVVKAIFSQIILAKNLPD